jgi:hypothetical protein
VPERARRLTRISPDLISVAACRVLHVRLSPSVFPSSSSPLSLPSPSTPPLFNHHGHLLFYTVIAEARHDASRLHTHRSHRLARHNRDSTTTTHLPSVTPNRERATTAWYTNWTLGTSLQASQDAFRPYSCRFGHHCDRGLRPVQIPRQRVLWLVFFRHTAISSTESRLLFGSPRSLGGWVRMFVSDSAGRGIPFLPD